MFIAYDNLIRFIQSPFFNLLFIMITLWTVGIFFERLKFPLIIGELLAGIILGPALLNWVVRTPVFDSLAQLGMFFLMFYAGLEGDPKQIRKSIGTSFNIGFWGTVFPFIFGVWAAIHFGSNLNQALLIGAAISGTSLVTKSRILSDFNILKTKLGTIMMGSAVIDNVFSFMILSLIIKSLQNDGFSLSSVIFTVIEVTLFFTITIYIGMKVFPKVGKLFSRRRGKGFTFALIMGLLFATLAEVINLPFILGAYLAGLFVREEIMSKNLYQKMDDRFLAISHGFLGPIFIMSVALKVSFDVLSTHGPMILAVFMAAFMGKLIGVYIGGAISRLNAQESLCMGFAMNGRGAVELVLAIIGVELGIITNAHLSMLVIVAFSTTFLAPLLLRMMIKQKQVVLK